MQRFDERGANSQAAETLVDVDPVELGLFTERVVVQIASIGAVDLADQEHCALVIRTP